MSPSTQTTSSPSTNGVSHLTRHPEYYIRDGNVAFLAEKILFRVHRFFFERESDFFREELAKFDVKDDATTRSRDDVDNHPLILDATADDFAKFLWVWYNPRYTYARQPKELWLVVVRLANMWGFGEMRKLAIRQLEKISIDPVDKIALYKEHHIDHELLLPSYLVLCKSPTLPSPAEGKRLEMDTVLKIATAREKAQRSAAESGCRSPTSASADDGVLRSIISDLFSLGFEADGAAKRTNGDTDNSGVGTIIVSAPNKKGKTKQDDRQSDPKSKQK